MLRKTSFPRGCIKLYSHQKTHFPTTSNILNIINHLEFLLFGKGKNTFQYIRDLHLFLYTLIAHLILGLFNFRSSLYIMEIRLL